MFITIHGEKILDDLGARYFENHPYIRYYQLVLNLKQLETGVAVHHVARC